MPRVTITVPEKTPQPYRFQLDRQAVTLGRGSDNDIVIDCGSVSVKHAEMRRVWGGYELRDLDSTNGIKLDDERQEVIPLSNGASVKLGDVAFDFLLSDEELEALAEEKPAATPPYMDEPVMDEPEHSRAKLPPLREEPAHEEPILMQEHEEQGGGYFGMVLLLLLLAAAAFCAGMSIRFQKETGGSLLDALKAKIQAMSAPSTTTIIRYQEAPAAATPRAAGKAVQ